MGCPGLFMLRDEDGTILSKVGGSNVLFYVSAQDRNALKKTWADHLYDPEDPEAPVTAYDKPKKTIKKKAPAKKKTKAKEFEDEPEAESEEGEAEGEEGEGEGEEDSAVATPN